MSRGSLPLSSFSALSTVAVRFAVLENWRAAALQVQGCSEVAACLNSAAVAPPIFVLLIVCEKSNWPGGETRFSAFRPSATKMPMLQDPSTKYKCVCLA